MSELITLNETVLAARQPLMTETALELAPDLTAEEWEAIGLNLGRAHRASAWWVGDWINYGEDAGYISREKYEAAEDVTGMARKTLRNYAAIARSFQSSLRRDDLSFTHHATVVALPVGKRDALLRTAASEKWSAAQLTHETRTLSPGDSNISPARRHAAVIAAAVELVKVSGRWERSMTDTLTPPQARKQLTVLRKAEAAIAEVIEAVEYRASTLHTYNV